MEQQKKQLSEHDKKILVEIEELNKHGYVVWPNIQDLADQLKNQHLKEHWTNVCKRYNHLEEASAGML